MILMSNLPLKSKYLNYYEILRIKLAQSTNKYTDADVDYYIKECSDILGITSKIENKGDPKATLFYVFNELANYKKLNP
jgi:intraflagellar transport protein 52